MSTASSLSARHRRAGIVWTNVWERELPLSFSGDPAAEHRLLQSSAGIIDASHRGIIDFEGAAAGELLDRITSNHAADLEERRGVPACLLSAKGRVHAALQLFRIGPALFRAVLYEPSRDKLLRELRKYALLSDVEIRDRGDTLTVLSVHGSRAAAVLESLGARESPPSEVLERKDLDIGAAKLPVVRVEGFLSETLAGGYDLWVPQVDVERIWKSVESACRDLGGGAVGWQALESARIEAGFPRWQFDYSDDSFPNEVGWEQALTYDKCYVGQEVVARMRTYGSVNRRLFQILPASDDVPPAGTAIVAGSTGSEAGKVTSSVLSFGLGRPLALGILKRRFWEGAGLAVDLGGRRVPVEVRSLPWSRPLGGKEGA